MAPRTIRRALGAVKDQTSIGLAKVGSSNAMSDLDVAIVKATRHEEAPADERHVRDILSLTSCSRIYVSACVNTLAKRLNKTRNWTVATKTLILIQRLLSEGDPAYEQEIFFATRRGTRFLNMSDFRDTSRSNSWDYSAFVRTYALYLDERLEYRMQGKRGARSAFSADDDVDDSKAVVCRSTPVRDMKTEKVFATVQHMQQILDRFLACRPTGEAKNNRVIIVALYPIMKESFGLYYDITEILGVLVDRFMELEIPGSVQVFEIFARASKQFEELDAFYSWCKSMGIARSSQYPEVEKITNKKLEIMDDFIRDKSALAQNKTLARPITQEHQNEEEELKETDSPNVEEDMNAIKALPPPEGFEVIEQKKKEEPKQPTEGDLLGLANDAVSVEDHANRLALALFDGQASSSSGGGACSSAWEAFNGGEDWETALVTSASHLAGHHVALPKGMDLVTLEGMYQAQQGAAQMEGYGAGGSASSVALGSAGRPAVLALPAPPEGEREGATVDPFAASVAIAPPSYVQMSELEKKQKLLMEEQMMWQQYARDGRQGHTASLSNYNGSVGSYRRF